MYQFNSVTPVRVVLHTGEGVEFSCNSLANVNESGQQMNDHVFRDADDNVVALFPTHSVKYILLGDRGGVSETAPEQPTA